MPKIILGATGLHEILGRDYRIEEPYIVEHVSYMVATATHVQHSRLDSSCGQSLESNGVCSKNETRSSVQST